MHILILAGFLLPAPSLPAPIPLDHALVALEAPLVGPLVGLREAAPDGLFAPATEALAFAWPEESEGLTLMDIVSSYGLATGQRLTINQETRQILEQTAAPLDRATSVPAAEVQGFVEALLRSASCVLTVDRLAEPRLIGVHSLVARGRGELRSRAISIDSTRIDVLRRHPAVLFSTVVHLPSSDVRQMSNSLRTMITDANTSQLLAAGSTHSMIVVGFGPSVADRIEELQAVDSATSKAQVTISHELVRLKNAAATDIAPLVEMALTTSRELRSPRIQGQPQVPVVHFSVLPEERLNGLLVTCRSEDLEEARAVIAQLDVK